MTKTYHFPITIAGSGDTPEEAWRDACDGFRYDAGEMPEECELVDEVD